jgi:AraC-like DNA-binding protein
VKKTLAPTTLVKPRRSTHPAGVKPSGPTVQAWVLPHLIAFVERQGIDATAIRSLPGLSDLTDPDGRVPEASAEQAWQIAATLTHDAAIGLHVAEGMPRGAMDLVEYALRSSASLGAGLERLARYGHVLSDRVAARMEADDDGLLLLVRDTGNTALHPARAEFGLAMALKLARESAGEDIVPMRVGFVHRAPNDDSEHRRYFGASLRFEAGSNSMLLKGADAARPMRGHDEALSSIIHRRLDKMLAERTQHVSGPLSAQVRYLMVQHLGERVLTPESISRALAVSPRTLSRRLAEEGTSFRHLLDDVRRDFACALLQDRSSNIGDVAFFLQYSEPAAFHRAFRRWTGQTPRQYRLG